MKETGYAAVAARTLEEVLLARAELRMLREWFLQTHVENDDRRQALMAEADAAMERHAGELRESIARLLTTGTAEEAELLPACAEHDDEDCGRRNAEACQTFKTGQRMCRGCGLDPVTGQSAK